MAAARSCVSARVVAWPGLRARPWGSPRGPGRGAPTLLATWRRAQGFRASAAQVPTLGPGPLPSGHPSSSRRLVQGLSSRVALAPRCPLRCLHRTVTAACPSLCSRGRRVVPAARVRPAWGGDGRSCGCGWCGWGGLPGPGGHRAQCPQGKRTELGDGDKAAWGRSSHHAWDWQWLQEGLLEVQVLPTGSRPCLCPLVGGGHQGLWGRQPGLGTPALGSGPAQLGSARSSSHTEWTEPRGKGGFGERVLSSCQPLGWAVGGTLAPWAGLAGGLLVLWGLARQWGGPGSAPWGVGRGPGGSAWGPPASRLLGTPPRCTWEPQRACPVGSPPWLPSVPVAQGVPGPWGSPQRGHRGRQQAPWASGFFHESD